ncbi:hypothetical protein J2T57_001315 [Natronocella acetinitrilica]|uniref:Uncharacterized protein n=1 Tax=Natronocella acetinitrilica TaxID=414046 RepID=A0AAE3G2Z3_9GAMM|nr:hypothetical protein [Natronocella acetinitrilica]MCP1674213.1 hypothetical protein [Natronocella acetinitrilica]
MGQLFLVLVSISLSAALMLSTISYLNPGAGYASKWADRMEPGVMRLRDGFSDYVDATGFAPAAHADFIPEYTFLPPTPQGLTWGFGSAHGGYYSCASGTASEPIVRALVILERRQSPGSFILNDSCGERTASLPAPGSNGQTALAVTVWLTGYSE